MTEFGAADAAWAAAHVVVVGAATVGLVRVADVVASAAALLDGLSDAERNRYADLAPRARRDRFLVGRTFVRQVAARLFDVSPSSLSVDAQCPDCGGPHGRPVLVGGPAGVSISIAYSADIVAVAVSADHVVGIDVEIAGSRAEELSALAVGVTASSGADALRTWTRVEAALKADGRGLRVDHSAVEFDRVDDQLIAAVPGDSGIFSRFAITDVDPAGLASPAMVSLAVRFP
ncbi:4'-phosphopantetheinyl transferase family protein [Amnibacterium flavum]|uniref:4'-phosphopantetheinyl transferase family protein n=1 Tax=Amnibacterium flavum TaxID=2173173 RepID=UPI0010579B33|nr:4-phosphopantetheinyl transferase [Amnibacterium flavum]